MKKITVIILGIVTIVLILCFYQSITKGGSISVLEIDESPEHDSQTSENPESQTEIIDKCCEILLKRFNYVRVKKAKVRSMAEENFPNRIIVEFANIQDTVFLKDLLKKSLGLGFWETYPAKEIEPDLLDADAKLRNLLSYGTTIDPKLTNSDSSNADSDEEAYTDDRFTKEHPLLSLLQIGLDSYEGNTIIGYSQLKDTAAINKYISMPEIQTVFPKDLRFKWSASPINFNTQKEIYQLYAIKSTEKDGKAPIREDVVIDVECVNDYYDRPAISISMNEEGARDWERMTRFNIGRTIAIVLDNHVYSAPQVSSEIKGGRSEISGQFQESDLRPLVSILKFGNMPATVKVVETKIIPDDQWSMNYYLLIGALICGIAFVFMLIRTIKTK